MRGWFEGSSRWVKHYKHNKNRVNQLLAGQSCFFFEVLLALLAFFSYDIFAEIFYTKEAI